MIHAAPGDVEVALQETPATGYRWEAYDLPAGVTEAGARFELSAGQPPSPGAGGIRVLRFHVAAPGVYEVKIRLKRSWERDPIQSKTVRLVIAD